MSIQELTNTDLKVNIYDSRELMGSAAAEAVANKINGRA